MSIEFPGDDKRCDWCDTPARPYEYRGRKFSGLTAFKGDKLCPACRDQRMNDEGVNILVHDDRPTIGSYVRNTVRDAGKITITVPVELRGIDGRDATAAERAYLNRRRRQRQSSQMVAGR